MSYSQEHRGVPTHSEEKAVRAQVNVFLDMTQELTDEFPAPPIPTIENKRLKNQDLMAKDNVNLKKGNNSTPLRRKNFATELTVNAAGGTALGLLAEIAFRGGREIYLNTDPASVLMIAWNTLANNPVESAALAGTGLVFGIINAVRR